MATAKQLDDMTVCPICTEVYTDPRVLLCGHTFCLKCIETWSKDKQSGHNVACPLCRKELTLPGNGVSDLPKNFFVADFLQMKELSSVESKTRGCEVCSGGDEATEMKVATVYCVECQHKLCQACEEEHEKFKVTSQHRRVTLVNEALSVKLPLSRCEKHTDRYLEIYCSDCKLVMCMICYITVHNKHNCSDVNEIADEFRERITGNINAGIDKCRAMLTNIEKEKNDFSEQVAKAEMEISEKAEQLKRMIDDHKVELMNELSSVKQTRMKEIESVRDVIERQLLSMESYKKEVDEVRQKETACDIVRAASGLQDSADELLKFDVIERTLDELGNADVTFTSSTFVIDDVDKTLGQLRLNGITTAVKSSAPTLTYIIESQDYDGVTAVTSLGDEVFVARRSGNQVEVYDAKTFTLLRYISVPEVSRSWGLAACAHYRCLYISDCNQNSIHRVELSGSDVMKKWFVVRSPVGLSVNKAHNVVVACYEENNIKEYTTHGTLVREIGLHLLRLRGRIYPWHAVQLSTGEYAVSQGTFGGVVSVVTVDGEFVCIYRPPRISNMDGLRSLAVTKNDDILVADSRNSRILSINSSLRSAQELDQYEAEVPWALCLDESRSRLYVGEGEGSGQCRVLVFDGVRW